MTTGKKNAKKPQVMRYVLWWKDKVEEDQRFAAGILHWNTYDCTCDACEGAHSQVWK